MNRILTLLNVFFCNLHFFLCNVKLEQEILYRDLEPRKS
jgi:hypothetical protein